MQRLKYLDIASGIMIVWLLLFHALYPMLGDNICGKVPYLYFFMPWFFYKSGMMFEVKSEKELMIKDTKKLLKNYLFGLLLDISVIFYGIGYFTKIYHGGSLYILRLDHSF